MRDQEMAANQKRVARSVLHVERAPRNHGLPFGPFLARAGQRAVCVVTRTSSTAVQDDPPGTGVMWLGKWSRWDGPSALDWTQGEDCLIISMGGEEPVQDQPYGGFCVGRHRQGGDPDVHDEDAAAAELPVFVFIAGSGGGSGATEDVSVLTAVTCESDGSITETYTVLHFVDGLYTGRD